VQKAAPKAPVVKAAQPVQKPVVKPAEQPVPAEKPAEPEHKPESVALDYQVPVTETVSTPVPTLNVPAASASARQLSEGTPVLNVPDAPTAPDFADAIQQESKA
jgi:hypothetical protein